MASVLTTGDFTNRITGPQDLVGSKVGTSYGSTAADYVANYGGMNMALYPSGLDTFLALKNGKVPAIILDYPVLVYYSRIYNDPGLTIVESILEYDLIGLATRQNMSLIPSLNGVIVSLTQAGYSNQLTDKWVGQPKRPASQAYDIYDTIGLWIWMLFWVLAGVIAFVAKKYLIKKSYKHTSWYGKWGGDEAARNLEDEEDAAEEDKKRLLTIKHAQSSDSFAEYSEGEETDTDPMTPRKRKLSINNEPEDQYETLM